MVKVILDTSFILTCIKQKIDFFEELEKQGAKPVIPKQVIKEIERVSTSNKKRHFREDAKIALKMLENEESNYETINLGRKHVDKEIKNYVKEHPGIFVATLDKEIIHSLPNPCFCIKGKKIIETR